MILYRPVCLVSFIIKWRQLLLLLFLMAAANAVAQILPNNRTPTGQGNWNGVAGIPGGIPRVTTVYKVEPAGTSETAIQTDVNNCPSNDVVQLAAGTFTFGFSLQIGNSGVVLRGTIVNGTNATIIVTGGASPGDGVIYQGDANWYNPWNNQSKAPVVHAEWTNGFTQGTYSIVVSNATGLGLTAGQLIFMDMKNDSNVDYVGHCSGPDGQEYTSVAHPNLGTDREQFQLNRVASISGNNITLTDPIYMPNYGIGFTNGLDPQIWWWGEQPVCMCGLEDLDIVAPGSSVSPSAIYQMDTYACWITNVNVSASRYYFAQMIALRSELRHNSAFGPSGSQDSDDYVFYPQKVSGALITDNFSSNAVNFIVPIGMNGSVISYNYCYSSMSSSFPNEMQGGFYAVHGGCNGTSMNLWEGNVGPGWWVENCWGSTIYQTALRNWFRGCDPPNTIASWGSAVMVNYFCRDITMIGNVLGTRGVNTYYMDAYTLDSTADHQNTRVYYVGQEGDSAQPQASGYDVTTYNTLSLSVNYDTSTLTNNGIVLNGFTTNQVPASLYLTSKPANFGVLPWPPIDPSNPSYSSSITNIPAGYRFTYGADPSAIISFPPPQNLKAGTP
jgi:hypothetical protein